MEIALIIVIAVLVICLVFLAVSRRKPENTEALQAKVDQIEKGLRENISNLQLALKGIENKVSDSSNSVEKSILRDVGGVKETLAKITTELDNRKKFENDLEMSARRIEAVVVGARARGRVGENILTEALKNLPKEIIQTNFKVEGNPVEYALILADGKCVPVDSKWTAPELCENLDTEKEPSKREEIVKQIESNVLSKVKEVTKYINSPSTIGWGIAAVPDAVFAVCRNTHAEAFRKGVIVMPYSLTLIYLLSVYQLHFHYYRSQGVEEKLGRFLQQIERDLDKLDTELENKLARGKTMLDNAYSQCRDIVKDMRMATAYLKEIPGGNEVARLEQPDKGGNKP